MTSDWDQPRKNACIFPDLRRRVKAFIGSCGHFFYKYNLFQNV